MNETILQGFSWYLPADGSHWRRLAEQAPTFAYEGITAVWMPPAYKGEKGVQDVGYGVYDTYDMGEFDQKGTVMSSQKLDGQVSRNFSPPSSRQPLGAPPSR